MKKNSGFWLALAAALPLCGCGGLTATTSDDASRVKADAVVYGKIYTARAAGDYAAAFAVKDGRYLYVGDEAGAEKYVQVGATTVIDRRGKGLVMPGATEGHGHYLMAALIAQEGLSVSGGTVDEILAGMRRYVAEHPGKKVYFVQGWETGGAMREAKFRFNMRKALDAICPDKPILMMDSVWHSAFLNSKAFETVGFTKKTVLQGGGFARDAKGEFLGLVTDVAVNYAMDAILAQTKIVDEAGVGKALDAAARGLHANGYTNYFDAYTNMLGEAVYAGVKAADDSRGLTFNMAAAYKIDPYGRIDEQVGIAADYMSRYASRHFQPAHIKLFADGGAVEVMTGWMLEPYVDGSYGNQVWPPVRFDEVVRKANAKGLSVQVHASGDGGTAQAVESFVKAEPVAAPGVFNGIAHSRHIAQKVKDVMAEHHVYSATNINWRYRTEGEESVLKDAELYRDGYPMKSLLSKGVVLTSATDYPANDGAPIDVCGIIEMGVNGTMAGEKTVRMAEREYLTVEEMLDVLTINGAREFRLEKERGSVEAGKYADFVFLSKDVTTCVPDKIHEGKVDAVYFEGRKVYERH